MTKHILALTTLVTFAFSCSEEGVTEYHLVPFEGEYYPVSYTVGSDKSENPVEECKDNIADFSEDLNEFMSGNLLVGRPNCANCNVLFEGQYSWISRCDQTYQYTGTWSTPDRGAAMSFAPELLPDSTLQFKAINTSSGIWKLRYDIGDEFVTINYLMKR
ncbi:MAG: hypothetical protein QM762_06345 [Chryseolinea sp.]